MSFSSGRETSFITGLPSSTRITPSNPPYMSSSTYTNPAFTSDNEGTDEEETNPKTAYPHNDDEETNPKTTYHSNEDEETRPKRTDSSSEDDETHPKEIYSQNDPQPLPSTRETHKVLNNGQTQQSGISWGDIHNQQEGCSATSCVRNEQEQRRGIPWLKFVPFTVLILGATIAVIIIIIVLRDSSPSDTKNKYGCTALGVNLGENIVIVCNTTAESDLNISIKPPSSASVNQTVLLSNQTRTNGGWTIHYTSEGNITLTGPQAKCSSAGEYNIFITDNVKSSSSSQIVLLKINVDPELVTDPDLNVTKLNCSKEAQCTSRTQCQESYRL